MEKKLTIENTRGHVDPCVYMLTAPSGKIYVGSTIQGFHLRSAAYRNEKAHGVINNALKKYRASNFGFSILESSKDWQKDKLQEREQHYLDTLQPFGTRGYNVERLAGIVTPKNERRVSQFTRAGEPVASYENIKWASVRARVHAVSITTCCTGKQKTARGFIWLYSEEATRQEIARRVERAASAQDPTPLRVSQYTKAGVFVASYESITWASVMVGVNLSKIAECCKGKRPSSGGFIWLYLEDVNEQEIARRVERAASVTSLDMTPRRVNQYTRAGEFIASFESIKEAARATSGHHSSITHCCTGKQKTARGFICLYSEEATQQEIARRVKQAADKKQEKPVSQYTKAGVLVKEYESASQAARATVVDASSITKCCQGKAKSAGGFIWKYA